MTKLQRSISFHQASTRTFLKHNRRETKEDTLALKNRESHIDADRTSWNEHPVSGYDRTSKTNLVPIKFNELFEDDLSKYNLNRRSDRRISDYYKHVSDSSAKSKKGTLRPYYESILQIGEKGDHFLYDFKDVIHGKEERDLQTEIFEEYLKQFNEEYNQPGESTRLVPMEADIHFDEDSPHMHFVYTPYADGYKKSLKHRPSLSKALLNLGYGGRGKDAFLDFTEDQRDMLLDSANIVLKRHGLDLQVERKKVGSHKHLDYIKYKDQIKKEEEHLNNLKDENEALADDISSKKADRDEIQQGVIFVSKKMISLDKKRQAVVDEIDSLQEKRKALDEEISSKKDQRDQLKKSVAESYEGLKKIAPQVDYIWEQARLARASLKALDDAYNATWEDSKDRIKKIRDEKRKELRDPAKYWNWSQKVEALKDAKKRQYDLQKKKDPFSWVIALLEKIKAKKLEDQLKELDEERKKAIEAYDLEIKRVQQERDSQLSQIKDAKAQLKEARDNVLKPVINANDELKKNKKELQAQYHDIRDQVKELEAIKSELETRQKELLEKLDAGLSSAQIKEAKELEKKRQEEANRKASVITGKAVELANKITDDDLDKLLQTPPAKTDDIELNLSGFENASEGRQRDL